eukprot:2574802-Alexandrium_andersonii.AAC.1
MERAGLAPAQTHLRKAGGHAAHPPLLCCACFICFLQHHTGGCKTGGMLAPRLQLFAPRATKASLSSGGLNPPIVVDA